MKTLVPVFVLFLLFFSCAHDHSDHESQIETSTEVAPGTQEMIDSLYSTYSRTYFYGHPYAATESVAILKQQIDELKAQNQMDWQLYAKYGLELLNAGQTDSAIQVLEDLQNNVPNIATLNPYSKQVFDALAIAWLRKGEQENCIMNHSEESCVFPIRGKGIHTIRTGSEKAIELYTQILGQFPDDLQSRWLLNIAYMTLGEYPDQVPAQFLIQPEQIASEYDFPEFKNIAMSTGLDINDLSGGVVADDFNNDGFIDLIASSWGMRDQIRFYLNNGDGTFSDQTEAAGLKGLTGGLNLRQADYNNDGFLDVLVLRGAWNSVSIRGVQPNSLLRNNGDGTFADITIEAGLYSVRPTQTATWLDFDLDGDLDLFVGNETPDKESFPCEFFRNNGDGTFTDIAVEVGLDFKYYIKGVNSGDINNDNLPDIYISRLDGPNLLLVNRGAKDGTWRFENIAAAAGVELPNASFPCWFFDYNNDGLEDILVASYDDYAFKNAAAEVFLDYLGQPFKGEHPRLYKNLGNETFEDVTKKARLDRAVHVMGCSYGDLDNDGYEDIYFGTGAPDYRAIVPNKVFRNDAGQQFQDVTTAGRFGIIQKGHGVGLADFDNDGDQDIYSVIGGAVSGDVFQNAFYENPGSTNDWLTIQLLGGKQTNRSATGARIQVDVTLKDGSTQVYHRTVSPGASFGGNSLQQEIGLGNIQSINDIRVNWPDKNNQYISYGAVAPRQKVLIEQGVGITQGVNYTAFEFVEKAGGHHHQHNH